MSVIQRDFLPEDLEPVLKENDIDGCVTVQSDQSEAENEFQLSNAAKHDFIKGVVGWVDLQAENVEERLQYYKDFKKMKGFRHVLQGEPQRDFMLRDNFKRGVGLLNKYGFTYDVLIYTDQLTYTYEFVKAFPEQRFVIDHLAKPFIKDKKTDGWKKGIEKISECENVYCKLSGMVTEADWRSWKKEDFTPYLDIVTEAFETKRIMYGSDWPVCLVAASYKAMLSIVTDYFSSYTDSEKAQIFGQNATQFYNLE
jgi:L-fuconolactonase